MPALRSRPPLTKTPRRGTVIGLTGGSGSGKSTLARMLAARGWTLFDADRAGHALYADPAVLSALETCFGPLGPEPRRTVGAAVAADPKRLADVDAIFFPALTRALEAFLRLHRSERVVIDAALLFEVGWDRVCDFTVCVDAPAFLRLQRVGRRSRMPPALFRAFQARQLSDGERRRQAGRHLRNGGGLRPLNQLAACLNRLGRTVP